MKRWLLVGDCHWPYADKRAWNLMLKTGPYDGVAQMGDFIDCATISDHLRSKHRMESLHTELTVGRKKLQELFEIADEHILLEGNHEERLGRYIANRAPELEGVVGELHDYLDPEKKWTRVPYGRLHRVGKLYLTHDQGPSGQNCSYKHANIVGHCVAHGHAHRLELVYLGTVDGKRRFGFSVGWLGDSRRLAFNYAKAAARANWQVGFGVAYVNDLQVHVQPVPIVNYRCVVDGVEYRG